MTDIPSRKKITVITTTFNLIEGKRKDVFIKMFKSVHAQTYPNIEHLIMDGDSKDGTRDFIEEVNAKYGKKELRIVSEPDKGITDATIKGYQHAHGEYIILMPSDDYYLRVDALELLADALEKEQADFACADGWWLFCNTWVADLKSFTYRHPFMISTMLAKKALFDKYGYFDPSYEMVADYELMFRLLSNPDIKGTVVPKTLTVLRPGGFSQTRAKLFENETVRIYKSFLNPDCQLTAKDIRSLHYGKCSKPLYRVILNHEKNKRILQSVESAILYQRPYLHYTRLRGCFYQIYNQFYKKLYGEDYFTRPRGIGKVYKPSFMKKMRKAFFDGKLPDWFCKLCCVFMIQKRKKVHFLRKYRRPRK